MNDIQQASTSGNNDTPVFDNNSETRSIIIQKLLNEYVKTSNSIHSTLVNWFLNEPNKDSNCYNNDNKSSKNSVTSYTDNLSESTYYLHYNITSNSHYSRDEDEEQGIEYDSDVSQSSIDEPIDQQNYNKKFCYPDKFTSNKKMNTIKADNKNDEKFNSISSALPTSSSSSSSLSSSPTSSSEEDCKKVKTIYKNDNFYMIKHHSPHYRNKIEFPDTRYNNEDTINNDAFSFYESNTSCIDNCDDDTNNTFDEDELTKRKPKTSNEHDTENATNSNETATDNLGQTQFETKWRIFSELYEQLKTAQNHVNKPPSIADSQSSDFIKQLQLMKQENSPLNILKKKSLKRFLKQNKENLTLEQKITSAIQQLKKTEMSDTSQSDDSIKNKSSKLNLYVKLMKNQNMLSAKKHSSIRNTPESIDLTDHWIPKRYFQTKEFKRFKSIKTPRSWSKKRPKKDSYTESSSDSSEYYKKNKKKSDSEINEFKLNREQMQMDRILFENNMNSSDSNEIFENDINGHLNKKYDYETKKSKSDIYQTVNDRKMIHETIVENSNENSDVKIERNYRVTHKKGSLDLSVKQNDESRSINCNNYSNETSYCKSTNNHIDTSIDKMCQSASCLDLIDDKSTPVDSSQGNCTKRSVDVSMSSVTVFAVKTNETVDSGVGKSVNEEARIENLFLAKSASFIDLKKPCGELSLEQHDRWSKICKAKMEMSQLPSRFSSTNTSKTSTSIKEVQSVKTKSIPRVIFHRETKIIELGGKLDGYRTRSRRSSFSSSSYRRWECCSCIRNIFRL